MLVADMVCPSDMDRGSEIKDFVRCNAGALVWKGPERETVWGFWEKVAEDDPESKGD